MFVHCQKGDVRGQWMEGRGGGERDLGGLLALVQRVEVGAWHLLFVRYLGIDGRPGDIRIFV